MTRPGVSLLTMGLLVFAPRAASSEGTRLSRFPDVLGDKIVFCCCGDLYMSSFAGR